MWLEWVNKKSIMKFDREKRRFKGNIKMDLRKQVMRLGGGFH
jgi:hypothetical protein